MAGLCCGVSASCCCSQSWLDILQWMLQTICLRWNPPAFSMKTMRLSICGLGTISYIAPTTWHQVEKEKCKGLQNVTGYLTVSNVATLRNKPGVLDPHFWTCWLNCYKLLFSMASSECHSVWGYQKYGSYFLSRDWVGLKWHLVLKVWEQL